MGLADEQNDTSTAVTRMRWAAKQAGAGMVMLRRTVELPAVPRTGEVVYADSYTELLTVTASPGPPTRTRTRRMFSSTSPRSTSTSWATTKTP